MDIQAKILSALADFDDLLVQGLTIEGALRAAASENEIPEQVLAARASRGMSLEDRRDVVRKRAELDRQAALQAPKCKAEPSRNGYWLRSPSGKKVWVDPSQFKFDF
jgi:hypothetical protein